MSDPNVYTEPDSEEVHFTQINNTKALLVANLEPCQIGIETDNIKIGFKDHLGGYHSLTINDNLSHKILDHSNTQWGTCGEMNNALLIYDDNSNMWVADGLWFKRLSGFTYSNTQKLRHTGYSLQWVDDTLASLTDVAYANGCPVYDGDVLYRMGGVWSNAKISEILNGSNSDARYAKFNAYGTEQTMLTSAQVLSDIGAASASHTIISHSDAQWGICGEINDSIIRYDYPSKMWIAEPIWGHVLPYKWGGFSEDPKRYLTCDWQGNIAWDPLANHGASHISTGSDPIFNQMLNTNSSVTFRRVDGSVYQNIESWFGHAAIGYCGFDNEASFAHVQLNNIANYALKQTSSGATTLNSALGQAVTISQSNSPLATFSGSGLALPALGTEATTNYSVLVARTGSNLVLSKSKSQFLSDIGAASASHALLSHSDTQIGVCGLQDKSILLYNGSSDIWVADSIWGSLLPIRVAGGGNYYLQCNNNGNLDWASLSSYTAVPTFLGGVGGDKGGEIRLGKPQFGGLPNDTIIDIYQTEIRFWEPSAIRRGAYIDIQECSPAICSKIWHSGNDGHGTGLDADTLDTYHASSFALLNTAASFASTSTTAGQTGGLLIGNAKIRSVSTASPSRDLVLTSDNIRFGAVDTWDYDAWAGLKYDHGAKTIYMGGACAGSSYWTKNNSSTLNDTFVNFVGLVNTNGLQVNGNKVMHAGNMGSGSGFDADMLDGRHWSNVNAYQSADNWWGDHAYFIQGYGITSLFPSTDWHSGIRFLHNNSGGYHIDLVACFHSELLAWRRRVNGADQGWRTIWHSGNMGSGSGLNADTLDTYHASSFVQTPGSTSQFISGNQYGQIDPNNVFTNSIQYCTGVNLWGQADGALYSQFHSNNWGSQIYQDYRTGRLAVRGKNNGAWTGWLGIWDGGNLQVVTGTTFQSGEVFYFAYPSGFNHSNCIVLSVMFYSQGWVNTKDFRLKTAGVEWADAGASSGVSYRMAISKI